MQSQSGGPIRPRYGRTRPPSGRLVVSQQPAVYDNQPKQPLPPPTGPSPYHLSLDQVLDPAVMQTIQSSQRLVFHTVGDTGGISTAQDQTNVVNRMIEDLAVTDPTARPAFFYHLGDVVYYNGETANYPAQFYEAYDNYQAHIFAIPGNHDGALLNPNDPSVKSLQAFVDNFCTPTPVLSPQSYETGRQTMIEPNVYWTLETPFATFIGLYTNVPEGGYLDNDQINWFQQELKSASSDKALILAMHHPIYSGDEKHVGSDYMGRILDTAIQNTGRIPDIVLAGHVHNYQRFTSQISGHAVPFIVAGAGGYYHTHILQGTAITTPYTVQDGLTLEKYCDDRWGYLLLEVTPQTLKGQYIPIPPESGDSSQPFDSFTLNWRTHQLQ